MHCRWLAIAAGFLLGGPVAAQDRPVREEIGSWVLSCSPEDKLGSCQLRHRTWVMPPVAGTPGVSLEVVYRGSQFLPVVALRGLATAGSLGWASLCLPRSPEIG